jgi:hypothetical protein
MGINAAAAGRARVNFLVGSFQFGSAQRAVQSYRFSKSRLLIIRSASNIFVRRATVE